MTTREHLTSLQIIEERTQHIFINSYIGVEGRKCFISRRTQHILFSVTWRRT